jgi:hypothetical protein
MAENTFEIGLCMAGAVSAGAYTAVSFPNIGQQRR